MHVDDAADRHRGTVPAEKQVDEEQAADQQHRVRCPALRGRLHRRHLLPTRRTASPRPGRRAARGLRRVSASRAPPARTGRGGSGASSSISRPRSIGVPVITTSHVAALIVCSSSRSCSANSPSPAASSDLRRTSRTSSASEPTANGRGSTSVAVRRPVGPRRARAKRHPAVGQCRAVVDDEHPRADDRGSVLELDRRCGPDDSSPADSRLRCWRSLRRAP